MRKWLGAGAAAIVILGGILATGAFAADDTTPVGPGKGYGGRMGMNVEMRGKGGFHGGNTFMADTIAKLANKPVEEVLKEKAPGVTWLDVAEKYGLKIEDVRAEHIANNANCPLNK